jgi:HK97 family phage prohead protease
MTQLRGLSTLHDGRPGLRTLLQVDVRAPASSPLSPLPHVGSGASILDFIASTGTLDRYHEVIEPVGWRLDSYRRNPVFQNAHNYGDILFTLGKALVTEVRSAGGSQALCQRIQFAADVNPVARIAYGLYQGGFLNAVSVGFIPLRWEEPNATKGTACPRRRYLEQELLEVSAVAIPANPDALALAVKSGAIPKSDLRDTLDLLRSLSIDYGPWSPPDCITQLRDSELRTSGLALRPYFGPRPSDLGSLLTFARELRRILRRT